jgi:hypothetical protein
MSISRDDAERMGRGLVLLLWPISGTVSLTLLLIAVFVAIHPEEPGKLSTTNDNFPRDFHSPSCRL